MPQGTNLHLTQGLSGACPFEPLMTGTHGRGRTNAERVLNPLPLPLGYMGTSGTRGRTRTDTVRFLKPLPLPIGVHEHKIGRIVAEVVPSLEHATTSL